MEVSLSAIVRSMSATQRAKYERLLKEETDNRNRIIENAIEHRNGSIGAILLACLFIVLGFVLLINVIPLI